MNPEPLSISLLFIATTLVGLFVFSRALKKPLPFLILTSGWLLFQSIVALSGFYQEMMALPPRFLLMPGPPMILILTLFLTKRGRQWLDDLNPAALTLFHTIRIPVEMVLYGLFISGLIPELMTFEGRNFDILTGLSAPVIYFLAYRRQTIGKAGIVVWNLAGLTLLFIVVIHAILSAPSVFQQMSFDQPNVGIFYFPFNWLPALVVPLAFLAHVATLWQCRK